MTNSKALTAAEASKTEFKWLDDSGVPGCFTVVGTHPHQPNPVCIIWVRWTVTPGTIEVLGSFVLEHWRRKGIRTAAHKYIASSGDVGRIVTSGGTESGTAWMKATGYRHLKNGTYSISCTSKR